MAPLSCLFMIVYEFPLDGLSALTFTFPLHSSAPGEKETLFNGVHVCVLGGGSHLSLDVISNARTLPHSLLLFADYKISPSPASVS